MTSTDQTGAVLAWLADDFLQTFHRDRRSRVLLWLDGRRDFARLLDAAEESLTNQGMTLLVLDQARSRGALWARWAIEVGDHRDAERVVLWIPGTLDELDRGELADGLRVHCLREYLFSGSIWRIDGRPPTLFRFLKHHKAKLPQQRRDIDGLIRGDRDSLLAKFAQANISEPEAFWRRDTITATYVEEQLVGNIDESLFALLADPNRALADLETRGVARELVAQLQRRFGNVDGLIEDPARWTRDFIKSLVVSEVHAATGGTADFPYATLLPEAPQRPAYRELLDRWMRDAYHQESFRRWATEIDEDLRLADYADQHGAYSDVLPSLAISRWNRFVDGFVEVGDAESRQREYLEERASDIERERHGFWAQTHGSGWALVASVQELIDLADRACEESAQFLDPEQFIEAFTAGWFEVDSRHAVAIRDAASVERAEPFVALADRVYSMFLEATNGDFYQRLDDGVWPPAGAPVHELAAELAKEGGRRVVLVVDALRFDLAVQLRERLGQGGVAGVVANLPSITAIGMTSLLHETTTQGAVGGRGQSELTLTSEHGDLSVKANRLARLEASGAEPLRFGRIRTTDIDDVVNAPAPPDELPLRVWLFDAGLDDIGHKRGHGVLRLAEELLVRLARAIKKLQAWGYDDIHVVTDHGFVVLQSDRHVPPMKTDINAFSSRHRQSRYGFVDRADDANVKVFPVGVAPDLKVAVPPGLRSFSRPGQFFHGGATLQEVVTPHLRIQTAGLRHRDAGVTVEAPHEVATLTVKITIKSEPPDDLEILDQVEDLQLEVFLGDDPEAPRSNVKSVALRSDVVDEASVTLFINREPPTPAGQNLPLSVINQVTGEAYAAGRTIRAIRDLS